MSRGCLPTELAPCVVIVQYVLPQHTRKLTVVFRESVTVYPCRAMESGGCEDDYGGGDEESDDEDVEKAQAKEEDEEGQAKREEEYSPSSTAKAFDDVCESDTS